MGDKVISEPCSSNDPKRDGICFFHNKRWVKTELVISLQSFIILSKEIQKDELRQLKAKVKQLDTVKYPKNIRYLNTSPPL